jgi:1-deoxy-D-xylulose-5-phosphate reductoisomerase
MRKLTILGSTGSIGCNTLEIVKMHPEVFTVKALTGGKNAELLAQQVDTFHPEVAAVLDEEDAVDLEKRISQHRDVKIVYGETGYIDAVSLESVDLVVSAMVGAAGLIPTVAAIDNGKHVALANKETLVMAGEIVMQRALKNHVKILPIDSEHSAIFQCLAGHHIKDLDKLFLTAPGGPFLNKPAGEFRTITPEDALNHPVWSMGKKISIDSATLMNKGLEVIEATHLFGISSNDINILIHPQSIVHSMVSFNDGSILAQLSVPDMKVAIAYAIAYPDRLPIRQPLPDFAAIGSLTFENPDTAKFPCLSLAHKACQEGGTFPAILNAANEIAVNAFLSHHIAFNHIPEVIDAVMKQHSSVSRPLLSDILNADRWARETAQEKVNKLIY